MSVSFSPNFTANQRVSFQKNHEKSSHSYISSTVKGAIVGGIAGAGIATATKKLVSMEIPTDSVTFNKVTKTAENLLGKTPVKKFAHIGATVGAIILALNTIKNKKAEAAVEKLKPIS